MLPPPSCGGSFKEKIRTPSDKKWNVPVGDSSLHMLPRYDYQLILDHFKLMQYFSYVNTSLIRPVHRLLVARLMARLY